MSLSNGDQARPHFLLGRGRRWLLGGVAAGIIAVVVVAITTGSAAWASAVLSGLALISAVTVGLSAYESSIAQLRLSRTATYLAHRPILTPIHETAGMWISQPDSVGLDGTTDPSFPSQSPFTTETANAVTRAFRVNAPASQRNTPRAVVFLRNVGDGPAMLMSLRIWSVAGHVGALTGRFAIAAREYEQFVIELSEAGSSVGAAAAAPVPAELSGLPANRVFLMEATYRDVFDEPRDYALRAWFDPRDRGTWRVEN